MLKFTAMLILINLINRAHSYPSVYLDAVTVMQYR